MFGKRAVVRGITALLPLALAAVSPSARSFEATGTWTQNPNQVGGGPITCIGSPNCTGTGLIGMRPAGCSNAFYFTTAVAFTGFDLSGPTFSGVFHQDTNATSTANPDGTCAYSLIPVPAGKTFTYSGTWDAASGSGTFLLNTPKPTFGKFTASGVSSSPVFPMTVDGSVTPTTAQIQAQFQPRPQDVGQSASVYVFAHAPSNLVSGASPVKRDPGGHVGARTADSAIVCVLAQVNSSGQLVAVSASTMQAYLTGVLSSQSQAVQVLNNVPTPNVAGATMYVGYGSSAQQMLSSGVFQTAVSVPGGVQCTASLASAPAPETPGPLTGLWWNPNEPGWGMHIAQRSNIVVVTWYTYDAAGNPKWYIASNCTGPSGSSGTCTGAVYEVNGPTFFGTDLHPISGSQVTQSGTLSINFTDANNATLNFTVAGVTRTVAITRQIFPVTPTAPPAVDYTDLWWNPNEAGWGMAITHQYGDIFLAWYVYDANGKPMWYVASNCVVSGSSCSGTLYRTTSAPFGPTYDTSLFKVFTAGSAIVSFVDANDAVLSYTVDGVTATKTIARQIFP